MVSEAANPNPSPVSTAATSSELELIEQLKRQLAGPVFAAVSDQFSHLQNTYIGPTPDFPRRRPLLRQKRPWLLRLQYPADDLRRQQLRASYKSPHRHQVAII